MLVAPRSPEGGDAVSALGRSLGAGRVVAVDALFLRAEAARQRGDAHEAMALYQAVLRLDPDDDAAAAYVLHARLDAIFTLPEADERFRAWQHLHSDVQDLLKTRARPAQLLWVAAQLIHRPWHWDEPLRARLRTHLGHPLLRVFDYAHEAALKRAHLPQAALDRAHLRVAANLAVELAAQALASGQREVGRRILGQGRALLALRQSDLAEMTQIEVEEQSERPALALDRLLAEGLALLAEAPQVGGPLPELWTEQAAAYLRLVGPNRAAQWIARLAGFDGDPEGG